MRFATCRYCKQQDERWLFVKYGVRHYAHLACLQKALTPDAFESTLHHLPTFQLKEAMANLAGCGDLFNLLRDIYHKRTAPKSWERRDHDEREAEIARVIATFPATFHLPCCEHTMRISQSYSFFSENVLWLYTEALINGEWLAYAKGTESELRNAVRP